MQFVSFFYVLYEVPTFFGLPFPGTLVLGKQFQVYPNQTMG